MADNTVLNAGSGGDVMSTDDLGAFKVQRVKVQHGADGSATDVSSASPLPVGLNTGTNALTSATRGSERALSVQIVDSAGAQVTSFGGSGGTASNFNSAFPSQG